MVNGDRINVKDYVTFNTLSVRLRQPICKAVQILEPFVVTILGEQLKGQPGDWIIFKGEEKFLLDDESFKKNYDILEE